MSRLRAIEDQLYPRSDCRTIGASSLELQADPVILGAGILEEHVGELVAFVGTTHHHVDILIAVLVQIDESRRVTLLKMPEAALERDFGEAPAVAAEHAVRNH